MSMEDGEGDLTSVTVATAFSSQAAGAACGEQSRSLSREVGKTLLLRQRKVTCIRDPSSYSPSRF